MISQSIVFSNVIVDTTISHSGGDKTKLAVLHVDGSEWYGGLMVGELTSRWSSLGSSPGKGHYVVFLEKTLLSQCLSHLSSIDVYQRSVEAT